MALAVLLVSQFTEIAGKRSNTRFALSQLDKSLRRMYGLLSFLCEKRENQCLNHHLKLMANVTVAAFR
jgi:hypothetical protein